METKGRVDLFCVGELKEHPQHILNFISKISCIITFKDNGTFKKIIVTNYKINIVNLNSSCGFNLNEILKTYLIYNKQKMQHT